MVARLIRAHALQAIEVFESDIAGDVLTREARGIELLDLGVVVLAGCHQIVEFLVHQPIGADNLADFIGAATGGLQFADRTRWLCLARRDLTRVCGASTTPRL